MRNAEVAAYIGRWEPSSLSPQAAAFARQVVPQAAPAGQERAKNLLWAAGKLAGWAIPLGLDAAPEVLLHPSVAERFTRCAPDRRCQHRSRDHRPDGGEDTPAEDPRRTDQ
jgi:hypothetical protein